MKERAKLFMNGNSQAVRLPKECRFKGDEVGIKKIGDLVVLYEVDKEWELFMKDFIGFSDDFHIDRDYGPAPERAPLI